MKLISALLLLLFSYGYAQAEVKRYDIEIIIFEDAHARYINSESWRQQMSNFDDSSNSAANFSSIKPYSLAGSYNKLKASSEYNVLFYGGWRQNGLSKKNAFTLSLDRLKNRHNTTSPNTISGDLKLVLARFLHVYGDLNYHRSDSPQIDNFPIQFHSRMRSKELHLVDHPLVGVLIQVNPVKVKTKKAIPTQESEESSTKKQTEN